MSVDQDTKEMVQVGGCGLLGCAVLAVIAVGSIVGIFWGFATAVRWVFA